MSGLFGSLGNLGNVLKQARHMQENMKAFQEEMAKRRFVGEAGGGMVKATVSGKGELVDIRIDPKAVEDIELLEDLIKASVAAASAKAQEVVKEEVDKISGGLNIPGLSDMLGMK